jgi:hypothetical protein
MEGKAMLTIVVSATAMNDAAHSTTRAGPPAVLDMDARVNTVISASSRDGDARISKA